MSDEMSDFEAGLRARTEEARRTPPTTPDLINRALTEPDEDKAWEAVITLHFRATREVFEEAAALCRSECPQERRLGADILGQLGVPDRAFPDECVAILAEMSRREADLEVVGSICTALGHLGHPQGIEPLLRWKGHRDAEIRWRVAVALGGYEEPAAVDALIELSSDLDEDVRDWATFGLGSQIDLDTPRIREALFARLTDTDEATRAEARCGLARRKDARVIAPLLEALTAESVLDMDVEAAAEIGDPLLLPALLRLGEKFGIEPSLEEAIRRCQESTEGGR